ncbi:prepilin-type N-terminal cleavage/methylation domain-containing protein [Opitutaceae bacterium TAV1]|nr:prepilin-type N-terminal cleavage/methylation domain-containing protein [Opitutaceae bacterium TAV1]
MTSTTIHRGGDSRAFTLIELLTVIAIIGILAAILIPTVGTVRKAANETKSLSNLRQIALAMNVYADESKGVFPAAYSLIEGRETIWTTTLVPYLGLPGRVYSASQSIYASPLAQIPVRDSSQDSGVMPCTYSLHGLLCPDVTDGRKPLPRDQVERPARVILVGESTQRSNNTYSNASFSNPSVWRTKDTTEALDALIPTDTDEDGTGGALRYRGRSGAPVAFVDGHVQSLKKGTVTYGHLAADR